MTEHESEIPDDEINVDLPPKLQSALRDLYQSPKPIDATVDQTILSQAREHLKSKSPRDPVLTSSGKARSSTRMWVSVAVVAAALLLVVNLNTVQNPKNTASPSSTTLVREDLDGNGHVDILDAFLLARKLEEGIAPDANWDLNQDGKVDQVDVQHAAMLAVRLSNTSTKG